MKSPKTVAVGFAMIALLGTACSTGPERDDSGAIVETGELDAFAIEVGDCMENPNPEEEFSTLAAVPCSEPHAAEAYHLFDLPDGVFPVADLMDSAATDGCLGAFETFVGIEFDYSIYGVGWMEPTQESWNEGDREIVCTIGDLEGELLVGSAKGSAK